MQKRVLAACVAAGLVLSGEASAQTLTIATEGGFGFRLVAPVVPVGIGKRTDIADPQPDFVDIAATSPLVGRGEMVALLPAGPGGFVIRIGVVGAGWVDGDAEVHESLGLVTCTPPPYGEKPQCEIRVCDDLEPCATFATTAFSLYREVMPVLEMGWEGPGGAVISFGARPFLGRLSEAFSSGPAGLTKVPEWADALEARFLGVLGTAEADLPLGPRGHLLLSAGAGGYTFTAHEAFYGLDLAGTGIRAQLGAGLAVDVGQRLSVGLMGRLDWWSVWPGVRTIVPDPFPCEVNQNGDPVCEPPRLTGIYGADTAPALNASLALRLTLQLGP